MAGTGEEPDFSDLGPPIPVVDRETFLAKSREARNRRNPQGQLIYAMYNSLIDAIVTDPELMTVPLDDHIVVRGHAIFDTATLINGRVYRLNIHLDRLFASAKDARLSLPFGETEDENRARITSIVSQTCVASGRRDASVRYYLSAGPGNFGFTKEGCVPCFYCVIYGGEHEKKVDVIGENTIPASVVPMKPPLLARVKSNNYMLNVLTAMASQEKGGKYGILVRDDGTVAEGCVANCALVTRDRVLITPPFGDILSGTTVRKSMEIARAKLVGAGKLLSDVRQEVVAVEALFAAEEVFMLSGDLHVSSIRILDGKPIGSQPAGQPGPVAVALLESLFEDAEQGNSDHIDLVY